MTDAPLPDYVTIPHASQLIDRSDRSIKRDINKALALQKTDFLENIYLETNDGNNRPGTECAVDEAERANDAGLGPQWHLKTEWLLNRYRRPGSKPNVSATLSKQSSDPVGTDDSNTAQKPVPAETPPEKLPDDPATRIIVLQDRLASKEELIDRLKEEIKDLNEKRQEDRDDQKDIRELLKLITDKLQPGGAGNLTLQVGSGTENQESTLNDSTSRPSKDTVVDAEVVSSDSIDPENEAAEEKQAQPKTSQKKATRARSTTKKGNKTGNQTSPKKAKLTKTGAKRSTKKITNKKGNPKKATPSKGQAPAKIKSKAKPKKQSFLTRLFG